MGNSSLLSEVTQSGGSLSALRDNRTLATPPVTKRRAKPSTLDEVLRDLVVQNRTDIYQALRPKLFGLAYRLLGSRADTEDLLQDVWFNWIAADATTIRDTEAGWSP